MSASDADDAEFREGRDVAAVNGQDAFVTRRRRAEIFTKHREIPETPQRFDVVGNDLQDLLAQYRCLVVPMLLDPHLSEGNQGLRKRRILVLDARENQRGFLQTAGEPQVVAEDDRVFRRELPFL